MRLGGPVFDADSPEKWIGAHRAAGYGAALWRNAPADVEAEYVRAAGRAGITIAEVGAWSNPLSPDAEERRKALEKCKAALATADRIGARCCVNIAGSRGRKWDGPCAKDLERDTFDMIVAAVREIIDDVRPSRTFYTLETMPWMYPDSADSYLELIRAIDRKTFAVHLDPVNLINSPEKYFHSGALIRDAFSKLGRWIRSCHGKDIVLGEKLTVHLDEVPPGRGGLDYGAYLEELARLDPDTPLILEHMKREEYPEAARFVREKAAGLGLRFIT
ncbi:MAG: sugar phosphate isomerase/epimerase [Planctomycetota bacterium]|nr:sugar phosphate isomerase/epimerase [Planctomycetota bacterium]